MIDALLLLVAAATPAPPPLDAAAARTAAVARMAGLAGEIVVTDAGGAARDSAFGLADRAGKRPHRVGERWLWASVTKQLVATLVLQEVDRGTLALDDPIARHLPDFGGDRTITIRELLQHRSGLPDPSAGAPGEAIPAFYRARGAGIGDTARARGFCAGPRRAPRGGDFVYNNCDYLVLGAILERINHRPVAGLLADRIARPAGLRSLRMAPDGAVRGGADAIGYDGAAPFPAVNVATFGAAAAATGTAADLAAVDRALMTGKLLSPASRAAGWEGDPKLGYEALGVWSFPARLAGCAAPVALVERRGDVGGTQVRNVIAPALGRALVVFVNDAAVEFGEVWQGKGLSHDLLAAAFCPPPATK